MQIRWCVAFFLVAFVVWGQAAVTGKRSSKSEQQQFSAVDAGVERPIPLPNDVLDILRKDDDVRQMLEAQEIPPEKLPSSWFSASAIHLRSRVETDIVVKGEPPVLGANVTTFWVFCPSTSGHELVLKASALTLGVGKKRWNRYLEIDMSSATASVLSTISFRFDGKRYVWYRDISEPIH